MLSQCEVAAQAAQHKAEIAQMRFEHSIEMEQTKANFQQAADSIIKDKEDDIIKAKASTQAYRQNWTKVHIQKSRLRTKLQGTVDDFEAKSSG